MLRARRADERAVLAGRAFERALGRRGVTLGDVRRACARAGALRAAEVPGHTLHLNRLLIRLAARLRVTVVGRVGADHLDLDRRLQVRRRVGAETSQEENRMGSIKF